MFRKNKDAFPATPNPATDPVAEPTPTQAEVADLSTEQMALTERCGELVAASAAAFHRELAEARGRGLSVEDQEAFIKSLWATRKIPRVLSTPLRSHSVGVATVKPEMVDEVKIYDLEKVSERSAEAAFSTAVVDRDFDRFPEERERENEPITWMNDLKGYFIDNVDAGFMPPASPETVEYLRTMATALEEASVVDVGPAQN